MAIRFFTVTMQGGKTYFLTSTSKKKAAREWGLPENSLKPGATLKEPHISAYKEKPRHRAG